jgi:hypothetical protein
MCGCLWHSCQCVSHDATLRHIWLLISGRIWRISVGPSPSSLVTIFYGYPEVWISLYHWTSVAVPCCPSFGFVQKFEDHLFDSLRNHEQVNFSDPDMFWTHILHDVRRNAWNSRWTFEVLCFFPLIIAWFFIIFSKLGIENNYYHTRGLGTVCVFLACPNFCWCFFWIKTKTLKSNR